MLPLISNSSAISYILSKSRHFSAISLKSCFFSSSSFEPFSSKDCFNPRCLLSTESFSFLGRYPTHSIPVYFSTASFRFKYSFSEETLFKITPFILTFSSNNLNPRISAAILVEIPFALTTRIIGISRILDRCAVLKLSFSWPIPS